MMKIRIEITCDSNEQFLAHLSEIRRKAKCFIEYPTLADAAHFSKVDQTGEYKLDVDLDS